MNFVDQSAEDDGNALQIMLEEMKSWGPNAPKFISREITPQHWNSPDGYYTPAAFKSTRLQCKPVPTKISKLLMSKPSGLRAKANELFTQAVVDANMAVDHQNIEFLPVWGAAVQRVDDHPTVLDQPMQPDCTHFCQGGSVNRFMNSAILSVASGMLQRSSAARAKMV